LLCSPRHKCYEKRYIVFWSAICILILFINNF
jgi:hypothetical protein